MLAEKKCLIFYGTTPNTRNFIIQSAADFFFLFCIYKAQL